MTTDRVREAISKVVIDADRDWNGNVGQYRRHLVDRLVASGLFAAEPSSEIETLRARELEADRQYIVGWNHGYEHAGGFPSLRFPTMLRKMWSGAEVQAWLDTELASRAESADRNLAQEVKHEAE